MCSICQSEQRVDIDRAIVSKESYNSIHKRFHVSRNTIKAHAEQCMARTDAMLIACAASKEQSGEQIIPYQTAPQLANAASLQQTMQALTVELVGKAHKVLDEVIAKGDSRNFAPVLNALIRTIESTQGRGPNNINIQVNNDIRQSREWRAMMRYCDKHPEAEQEILSYLN